MGVYFWVGLRPEGVTIFQVVNTTFSIVGKLWGVFVYASHKEKIRT